MDFVLMDPIVTPNYEDFSFLCTSKTPCHMYSYLGKANFFERTFEIATSFFRQVSP